MVRKLLAAVLTLGIFGGVAQLGAQDPVSGSTSLTALSLSKGSSTATPADSEFWGPTLDSGKLLTGQEQDTPKKETQREGKKQDRKKKKEQNCPARWEKMLGKKDKNGDGKISKEEFGGKGKRFDRIDKDGDGFIEKAEFISFCAQKHRKDRKGGEGEKQGEGKKKRKKGGEKKGE